MGLISEVRFFGIFFTDFKCKRSEMVKYKGKIMLLLFSSNCYRLTQSPSRLKLHVYPLGLGISPIVMEDGKMFLTYRV